MAHGLGSLTGRVCVVTGAGSGIGRATALALAQRGTVLALVDRDAASLPGVTDAARAFGARVLSAEADVGRPEAVERVRDRVEAQLGVADLLINVAGIAQISGFLATSAADWQELFAVNVAGVANVCRAFLPAMLARDAGGFIVNVASAAVFATPRDLVLYGATKHAVLGLSEGLADELYEAGIGVSTVCPGFVDTPLVEHLRVRGAPDEALVRNQVRQLLKWRSLSAERVADAIVRAAERGDPLVMVGLEAHLLALARRLSPRAPGALLRLGRALGRRFGT